MLGTNWEDAESEQDETWISKRLEWQLFLNHGNHMAILFMNSWLQKFQSKPTISSVANAYQMNVSGTNR